MPAISAPIQGNITTLQSDALQLNSGNYDAGSNKIINLADGNVAPGSSEAVTGGQLHGVQQTANNANQGWDLQANGGTAENIAPGDAVNFKDGDNINITRSGQELEIATSATPNFTTVTTTGDLTVGGGASVTGMVDMLGGLTVAGGQTVDMGGNKVTNVADGTVASDAVNKGQLDTAVSDSGWKLQADSGSVADVKNGDTVAINGGSNIETSQSGQAITVKTVDSPQFGAVTINDGGSNTITGLADGSLTAGSDEAVNGGQVNTLGSSVADRLGGGASFDAGSGEVTQPTYTFTDQDGNDTDFDNVGDALGYLSGGSALDSGIKYFHANSSLADSQANGDDSVAIGPETIADGNNSLAAGYGAEVSSTGQNGIALGHESLSEADAALAIGFQSNAALASSTAIGDNAQALADSSIALGRETLALGDSATSIGATGDPITTLSLGDDGTNLTSINGISVTATGTPLDASGNYNPSGGDEITAIAGVPMADAQAVNNFLGRLMSGANLASGDNSVATGVGTFASGKSSVAVGDRVVAGNKAVGIGSNVVAGNQAVGVGPAATAGTKNSFAGGNGASVVGRATNGVAIGNNAQAGHGRVVNPTNPGSMIDAAGASAVAVGDGAQAQMDNDVALGAGAGSGSFGLPSADNGNVSIGHNAGADIFKGGRNVAIGSSAGQGRADDSDENVAIGNEAGLERGGNYNIAIGKQAGGLNAEAPAIGPLSTADTISMGRKANATEDGAMAFGNQAKATGGNSLALGANAKATSGSSVALGSGSVVDTSINDPATTSFLTGNTAGSILSIGSSGMTGLTRRIVNVAGGVADTDAVNVGQLKSSQNKVAAAFGGGVIVDADGNYSDITVGGTQYGTLADAIAANGGGGGGTAIPTDVVRYQGGTGGADKLVTVDDPQSDTDAVNLRTLNSEKAHFLSVNSTSSDLNYGNDGASGTDAIAIGANTGGTGDAAISIGKGASAENTNGIALGREAKSQGNNATAVGHDTLADADQSVVIGYKSRVEDQAGKPPSVHGVAIGSRAKVTRQNGTAIGREALVESAQGQAFGRNAYVHQNSDNAIAMGETAVVNEDAESAMAFGDDATVIQGASNSTAIGTRAQTSAGNAYALGTDARSTSDSAYAQGNTARATGNRAFALGSKDGDSTTASNTNSYAVGAGAQSEAINAYAIGAQAQANKKSGSPGNGGRDAFAIGTSAVVNEQNAYAVGNTARATALSAYAVGDSAESSAESAYAMGDTANVSGGDAFALGSSASVNRDKGYAIGNEATSTGESGYAIGDTALAEKADSFAVGSNANADGVNAYALGNTAAATGSDAIAFGTNSVSAGENAIALGNGANIGATGLNAIAIGTGSQASGENAVALGNGAKASGINSLSFGTDSVVTGDGSGAFGDPNTVDGLGSYVVGNNNTINTGIDNTFVLGNEVTPTQANSVVLGNQSTDRAATTESGVALNDNSYTFAGQGSVGNGVVSVGDTDKERQLINVAAGEISKTSTDAINGSQLYATNQAVQQPITFEGDNGAGNAVDRTLNSTLNIQGGASGTLTDDNIGVEGDGSDTLKLKLAENVDLGSNGSVKTGNSELDNDGLTVNDDTNSTDYGADEIAMSDGAGKTTTINPGTVEVAGSGNTITVDADAGTIGGLTNQNWTLGQTPVSGQAATEDQLSGLEGELTSAGLDFAGNQGSVIHKNLGDELTIQGGLANTASASDENIRVDSDGSKLTVKLANDLTGLDSVEFSGGPKLSSDSGDLKVGDASGNPVKIINVADGTVGSTSKDAINGSQLNDQGEGVQTIIGGTTTYDPSTGSFTNSDIGGTGEDNISDAIASAGQGWNLSANGGTAKNVKPGDTIDVAQGSNIEVSQDAGGNLTIATVDAPTFTDVTADSVTTGNSVMNNDGLTVDDGAGNSTTITTGGTEVADASGNTSTYGPDGSSISDGSGNITTVGASDVTLTGGPNSDVVLGNDGLDNGGNQISNVASGGTTTTNAANIGDVQSASSDLTTKGLNFTGDNSSVNVHRDLGETLAINGGASNATTAKNIVTTGDASGAIQIDLAETVDLGTDGSVQTGDSLMNNDGLAVDDGAGNSTTITTAGTTVTDGSNTSTYGPAGSSITDGTNTTTVGASDVTLTGGPNNDVVLGNDGLDNGGNVIAGVGDGAISTSSDEAINGSQLQAAGDSLANNVLGGNADYTGNDFTMSDIGGTGENTIDDAIASAGQGWNLSANGGTAQNVKPGDTIDVAQGSNIDVSQDASGNLTIATVDAPTFTDVTADSVTTGNSVMNNDGLTVDDGAGNSTTITTAGSVVTDGTNTTTVGASDVTLTGGPNNDVVLGNDGLDNGGNQITNVASGGTTTTNAANIGDVQSASSDLTTKGLNFTGDNSSVNVHRDLGETLAINGGASNATTADNIVTTGDAGGAIQIDLSETVDLGTDGSVQTGESLMNNDGLAVDDGAGNSTTITTAGSVVTDGTNTTAVGASDVTLTGGPNDPVVLGNDGLDNGGNVIAGVGGGAISTSSDEAINGSQLQAAGDSLADQVLGGDADYTGNDFTMSDVGGTGENTIDDAIKSANTAANAGWDLTAQGANSTNVGPNDSVDLSNTDGNIEVAKTGADNDVTFDLADDLNVDSVTTGNSVMDNSGLTVDDGGGNVTSVTTGGTSVTDGSGNITTVGASDVTLTGGPNSDVVLGNDGLDNGGNQISNVASGGTTTTNAANIGDVQSASSDLTTKGLNFTGDNSSVNVHRDLGETLAINGGASNATTAKNIVTTGDASGAIQIDLAETVDLGTDGSVQTGESLMNNDGLAVDDGAGNSTTITTAGTVVTDGSSTSTYGPAGSSITDGTHTTTVGASDVTLTGGPNNDVVLGNDGLDNGGNVIAGVGDGAISTSSDEAINGSQLQAAGDSLAGSVLGGDAAYDGNTNSWDMGNDIGGTGEGTIDEAISSANTAANAGWDLTAQGANSTNVGPNDAVDLSNTDGNIEVAKTGANNDVTFDLASDLNVDSVTTGNSVMNNDGLTVKDGAGNITKTTATGTNVTDGTNTTDYGPNGVKISGPNQDVQLSDSGLDNGNNTIINVADPVNDTDGANKRYVDSAGDDLIDKGLNFAGDSGTDVDRDLGETLNIQGGETDASQLTATSDKNIGVVADGSDTLDVRLAKNIDLGSDGSVTAGDSTLDNDGLAVDDGTGNITRVAATGTTATDGTDTTVYGPNGVDINGGDIVVDNSGLTVAGGASITTAGIDAGSQKITNVGAGTIGAGSTEAINGSQLQTAGDNLANNVLGGNADYTGNDFTMSDIGNTGQNTVHDAIDSVNTAANAGWNVADTNGNSNNIGPNGKVTFAGDSNVTVTESGSDDDGKISVALNDTIALDSVTTGNSVMNNDGLTVDDGAGNSTTITTAGTTVTDGGNTTDYGPNGLDINSGDIVVNNSGLTVDGGASITTAGIDAGNQKITNVAKGTDLSDAVNKGQLDDATGELTTAGLDFTGDSGAGAHTDLGETLAVTGGATDVASADNIGVEADGKELKLKLAKDVDLGNDGSVTTGNSVMDNDGLAVDDGAGNSTTITTAGTVVTDGSNTSTYGPAGSSITDGTNTTTVGASDVTLTGGPNNDVVLGNDGLNNGGNVIAGVGDGAIDATSNDAINGSQMQAAGDSLAGDVLGGNAKYDGNEYRMSDIGGTGKNTIHDAIGSVNTAANAGWNLADGNGNSSNIGPGGQATFVGDSNISVTESGSDDDGKISVALNKDVDLGTDGSVTTGDSVMNNDGLTVDDGAGNKTTTGATGTTVVDANGNQTTTGATGTTVTDTDGRETSVGAGKVTVAGDSGNSVTVDGDSGTVGGLSNTDWDPSNVQSDRAATEGQLADVSDIANNANQGWNVTAEGKNSSNVKPGDTVDFNNKDGNVDVSKGSGNEVTVDLADDVEVDSVTTGDSKLDDDGLTVTDGPTVTKNDVDMGDQQIHGVEAGTAGTDAVNVDQLDKAVSSGGQLQVNDTAGAGLADASGDDAVAGGGGAQASGDSSTALGANANAEGDDSVALGADSVAKRDNSVSMGSKGNERQVTNVAAGTEPTDAVNVSQLNKGMNEVADWSKRYTDKRVNALENQANAGVASAMAMAGLPQAYQPSSSAASASVGHFNGESALAVGVSTITDSGRFIFKLNGTANSRDDVGGSVGAAIVW